jgi:aspartyl-tRNA(Asn)/glutamyl-tRNA(Gln) amidotransferase subunit C
MSKLTRVDILKLAHLAQLDLTDDEVDKFQIELTQILQYVEQLQAFDGKDIKPTNQVTNLTDVMRKDEEIDYQLDKEILFRNVPKLKDNQIEVKRVL